MKTMTRALLAAAMAFPLMMGGANASSLICDGTPASDVTLTIDGPAPQYRATSCAFFNTNHGEPASELAAFNTAFVAADEPLFIFLSKAGQDIDGNPVTQQGFALGGINGITFTVTTTDIGEDAGAWTVTWVDNNPNVDPSLPVTVDLGVYLKGSNRGAAYLLEQVLIPESPTFGTGTFTINFTNQGGQTPDLSHLTLFGRFSSNGEGGIGDPDPVPEPATLALFGAGLLGLAAVARRRRRQV